MNAAARFSQVANRLRVLLLVGGRRHLGDHERSAPESRYVAVARRKSEPRIGVLDSQSVKTSDQAGRAAGSTRGKKVNGKAALAR
ncbi:MAG: hypothetical protein R3B91_18875 [Planctomycetaceae bacterium]